MYDKSTPAVNLLGGLQLVLAKKHYGMWACLGRGATFMQFG
jgi:hypothetical protein